MNKYNPKYHHRRSIRLKGYDYTQAGLYFISICVQDKRCLFGEIKKEILKLNSAGIMIEKEWLELPKSFKNIKLDSYIIMPNHFHAILEIVNIIPKIDSQKLGNIIGVFKSITTNRYIQNVKSNNWERFEGKLWQRNYYEHIIRNKRSYSNISKYIKDNPLKWNIDKFHQ